MGEWIAVTDRLPVPHKSISEYPVLVAEKWFSQPMKGWYYGVGYFGGKDTNWRVEGMNGAAEVTHWMPMPAMPVTMAAELNQPASQAAEHIPELEKVK